MASRGSCFGGMSPRVFAHHTKPARRYTTVSNGRTMPRAPAPLHFCLVIATLVCCCQGAHADVAAPDEVSFRNDVMPLISKAGCNAGGCHGNKSGKGGFKLSLWGEDPAADFETLTRDFAARRTNPVEPEQSLI